MKSLCMLAIIGVLFVSGCKKGELCKKDSTYTASSACESKGK